MNEFFQLPVWGAVAAVAAVLAIIVPVVLYVKSRPVKRIEYYLSVNRVKLSGLSDSPDNLIKITIDGKPVKELYTVIMGLRNAGNRAIASADYEVPLQLDFGDGTQLISGTVLEARPSELAKTVQYREINSEIQFERFLLNPRDKLTFQALVIGKPAPTLFTRVIGMSEGILLDKSEFEQSIDVSTISVVLSVGIISLLLFLLFMSLPYETDVFDDVRTYMIIVSWWAAIASLGIAWLIQSVMQHFSSSRRHR